MAGPLPSLVLTGASGIVGRNFLQAAADQFRIYAIARRPQHNVGVPNHPSIHWIQVAIGSGPALSRVTKNIERQGGADLTVHLAAHYDLENVEQPEDQHTNVEGTRNVLELAKRLGGRRFIFTSSVAACRFSRRGAALSEESPPDADFPCARSKRAGEDLVREYSKVFPCSVVRLAAVISDWCEYAPLYVFLTTWLAGGWSARVLGGRGQTAVPCIHARDLNRLFMTIIERTDELPPFRTYIASPDGATTKKELFELVTRFHFGRPVKPLSVSKPFARVGIVARDLWGRLRGERPFERLWMLEYLDRALVVDASRTRRELGWAPRPRRHVLRRIIFMIETMKSEPLVWQMRNERALRRTPARPALVIHDAMMEAKDAIIDPITDYLRSPVSQDRFPRYARMEYEELRWYVDIVYELLLAAVRTGDRALMLDYVHDLARRRYEGGFPAREVCDAVLAIDEIVIAELMYKPDLEGYHGPLRDSITLSIALAIDSVQDVYEGSSEADGYGSQSADAVHDLEGIVARLNAFYRADEPGPRDPALDSTRSGTPARSGRA